MYSRYLNSYARPTYTAPKVYPQDIQCIIQPSENKGGVYVSNVQAAKNINTLKKYKIKAILTAANGVKLYHPKQDIHSIKYVPADDHEAFDISRYFDESVEWIRQNLENCNILVHCMAGVSRSVSLLLAYLIKHRNMRFQQAFDFVKRKRRIIHPNSGFIRQLKEYQDKHRSKSVEKIDKNRTPSPKPRGISHAAEPKTATTPNLLRYTDYKNFTDYKTPNAYSATKTSKIFHSGIYEKPSFSPQKMTESDLDQRIEEIRKKYSNKSEYIPSKNLRGHSSYRQARTDGLFDKDLRLSKYYDSAGYKSGIRFADKYRNPELYGGNRLYNNYLYSGGY